MKVGLKVDQLQQWCEKKEKPIPNRSISAKCEQGLTTSRI